MKIVVFGSVISGQDLVREIERLGSESGKVSKSVTIVACGEIDPGTDKQKPRAGEEGVVTKKKKMKSAAIKDIDC